MLDGDPSGPIEIDPLLLYSPAGSESEKSQAAASGRSSELAGSPSSRVAGSTDSESARPSISFASRLEAAAGAAAQSCVGHAGAGEEWAGGALGKQPGPASLQGGDFFASAPPSQEPSSEFQEYDLSAGDGNSVEDLWEAWQQDRQQLCQGGGAAGAAGGLCALRRPRRGAAGRRGRRVKTPPVRAGRVAPSRGQRLLQLAQPPKALWEKCARRRQDSELEAMQVRQPPSHTHTLRLPGTTAPAFRGSGSRRSCGFSRLPGAFGRQLVAALCRVQDCTFVPQTGRPPANPGQLAALPVHERLLAEAQAKRLARAHARTAAAGGTELAECTFAPKVPTHRRPPPPAGGSPRPPGHDLAPASLRALP